MCLGRVGGRERGLGDGSQVKRGRADEWARGWDVAPRLCVHDTQQRCTSGPSVSESRTVRGWGDVAVKSMCPRLTVVGHVA